jgi:peptidoglycan/LPS O-acetylase OafA/YrhL
MPRLDPLTGARWWAAFFVFFYHMLVFAPLPGVAAQILGQGFLGVTFFFVLSGFVLTWSASNAVSLSTFYWRRFARIWPVHVAALLLAVPVFYTVFTDSAPEWVKPFDVAALLLTLVLLQAWFRDPSILFAGNPASWTLSCEAFFYALHPWIGRVLARWRVRGALVFVVAVIATAFAFRALALADTTGAAGLVPVPVVRLSEFVLGAGLAWAVRCGWRPRLPTWLAYGTVAAILAAIVLIPTRMTGTFVADVVGGFANEIVTLGCALVIVVIVVRSLAGKRSSLEAGWVVRLGEWSYAFYLVHATAISLSGTARQTAGRLVERHLVRASFGRKPHRGGRAAPRGRKAD